MKVSNFSPAGVTSVKERGSRMLFTIGNVLFSIIVLLTCFAAYWLGMLFNVLYLLLLACLVVSILSRSWGAFRRKLEYRLLRQPLNKEVRWYLLQCVSRWFFWLLLATTLWLAIVPIQFEPSDLLVAYIMVWGSAGLLMALELIPGKRIYLATNILAGLGGCFLGIQLLRVFCLPPEAGSVTIDAPFQGEWYVIQGGPSSIFNHHYPYRQQRHALDIVKPANGRETRGEPDQLESYPAFGQVLYAPADGEIVKVVNDRPDLPIGETDSDRVEGNNVIIEVGRERFVLLAHLMKGSVVVTEGDRVSRGQCLARCGNSGNTSSPHLHIQVQNRADFDAPDLETFPIVFQNVSVIRWGRLLREQNPFLRRNDILVTRDE
jgi:Peptidase family M23